MEEIFASIPPDTEETRKGRVLIVDDDPMLAEILGISLCAAGYEILVANSGENALDTLAELDTGFLPDIIFLDIEMGDGIDGYETCRRLRTSDVTRQISVIFLSGHDELDERLCAYDAGGSDFISKPFVPAEVLRKARLAISHMRLQAELDAKNRASLDLANKVLTGIGHAEVALKFCCGAFACQTLPSLAALMIKSMGTFGVDCYVQLRTPTETLTQTLEGPASPLEESVIDKLKTMGTIFCFKNRFVANYEGVSLVVTNMPMTDTVRYECIRHEAVIIAETANYAVRNITLHADELIRLENLRKLAELSGKSVGELRGSYRKLHVATRLELDYMESSIEEAYGKLDLTGEQEIAISNTVRNSVNRVLTLFEGSSELDRYFAGIIESLSKAGDVP